MLLVLILALLLIWVAWSVISKAIIFWAFVAVVVVASAVFIVKELSQGISDNTLTTKQRFAIWWNNASKEQQSAVIIAGCLMAGFVLFMIFG